MLLKTIFERILVKSGQFLMRVDNVELDPARFRVLVEDVLAIYNKYRPMDGYLHINVGSPRTYTFTEEIDGLIPRKVIDAVPVRPASVNPYMLGVMGLNSVGGNEYLQDKGMIPFEYRKPNLTVSFSGYFDVQYSSYYEVKEEQDNSGEIVYSVPHLKVEDTYFFELLKGIFLQSLGRSRRAFTLTDLPITMDADQITSEGIEIYEKAFEHLVDNAKFDLAMGG